MRQLAIINRIESLRQRVADACQESSVPRAPASVTILAVSKRQPAASIAAARQAGIADFGENYVQEAADKAAELGDGFACSWHLVGPLQTNKAAAAARLFSWIHSLDRAKVARRLGRARSEFGLEPIQACVQINLGQEGGKAGIAADEADDFIAEIDGIDGIAVRGLMCIPEAALDQAGTARRFGELAELLGRCRQRHAGLDTLSMGMSNDYIDAVRMGATIIRPGTAIFGPRQ